jgi:ribonuclease HI
MIVIMCDGSSKVNPGPASIGVIVWDRADNPRLIKPSYHWHRDIGTRTNMEAEWEALLSALDWVSTNTFEDQEVFIFSDSQTVVKQATGIWNVKHEHIVQLYSRFQIFMRGRVNVHIQWVPRQLIYLADKAAQQKGDTE